MVKRTDAQLEHIEHVSFALFEAFSDLADMTGLGRVERHAAIELLHYTTGGAMRSAFTDAEKADLDELRRALFARAEKHLAENTLVNAGGGQG